MMSFCVMYSFKDTASIMTYTLQETAMNMLKALEDVIKKEYNGEETLDGYIQFEEAQEKAIKKKLADLQKAVEKGGKGEKIFTLRLREGLNERFENATNFEGTTKSKVLRSLIEFYIVQVEKEMNDPTNRVQKLLTIKDEKEQLEMLLSLTQEEQLEFLRLKNIGKAAKDRENAINEE